MCVAPPSVVAVCHPVRGLCVSGLGAARQWLVVTLIVVLMLLVVLLLRPPRSCQASPLVVLLLRPPRSCQASPLVMQGVAVAALAVLGPRRMELLLLAVLGLLQAEPLRSLAVRAPQVVVRVHPPLEAHPAGSELARTSWLLRPPVLPAPQILGCR